MSCCDKQLGKWQRRKDARPGEIIEAALSHFSENGFAATRMEDVARSAGISKGTLYLYFNSKEEMFCSVVEELVTPRIAQAEEKVREFEGSAEELLRQIIDLWWTNMGESKLCGIPKMMIAEAANFPQLAEYFLQTVIHRVRRLLESIIQKGIDSGEFIKCDTHLVARSMIAPVIFAAIWKKSLASFDKEDYDERSYLKIHMDIYLKGLRREGAGEI